MQGLAGAVTSPATLSIITSTLPEGPERNRGLGLWGAMGALGASSGALLGGVLTQTLGWQAIFAVNVPIGAIVVALGLRAIPRIDPVKGPRHFDALGATLITGGLIGITYGIVRTDTLGWGASGVLVPLSPACADGGLPVRRGAGGARAAGAAVDLPPAPTAGGQPRRAADVRGQFPDLVLHHRCTCSRCCTTTRSRPGWRSCR